MTTVLSPQVKPANLYRLIDEAAESMSHRITGKRAQCWCQEVRLERDPETLYLLSVPGHRESIRTPWRSPKLAKSSIGELAARLLSTHKRREKLAAKRAPERTRKRC